MSEVKLNLTDSQLTIHGTIHGSVADRAVAALSAEPETIAELEAALARYDKPDPTISPFAWFHAVTDIDTEPWDAGIVIIDLAARIVACESTYSRPRPQGEVHYHDGICATDILVLYRVPEDWLFLNSIVDYEGVRQRRRQERAARLPLDARAILYGRPLLEFIARQVVAQTSVCEASNTTVKDTLIQEVSALHARWLMTPREDLRGQAPRDLLLAKQDFIDYDLHTRQVQWSLQGEGPPCLATDSFAYRFAGFGTHEWVIYYDLVRHLLWRATLPGSAGVSPATSAQHEQPIETTDYGTGSGSDRVFATTEPSSLNLLPGSAGVSPATSAQHEQPIETTDYGTAETEIARLEKLKTDWLEQPQCEYGGRIPALLIENERKRLPIAMLGRDMVIDEDCPVCQMMGAETGFGLEVGFWHLDAAHMDDDFAFSDCRTREEWEAENRRREKFNEEFNRRWAERQQCIARGEPVVPDPFFDLELPLNINLSDSEDAGPGN